MVSLLQGNISPTSVPVLIGLFILDLVLAVCSLSMYVTVVSVTLSYALLVVPYRVDGADCSIDHLWMWLSPGVRAPRSEQCVRGVTTSSITSCSLYCATCADSAVLAAKPAIRQSRPSSSSPLTFTASRPWSSSLPPHLV